MIASIHTQEPQPKTRGLWLLIWPFCSKQAVHQLTTCLYYSSPSHTHPLSPYTATATTITINDQGRGRGGGGRGAVEVELSSKGQSTLQDHPLATVLRPSSAVLHAPACCSRRLSCCPSDRGVPLSPVSACCCCAGAQEVEDDDEDLTSSDEAPDLDDDGGCGVGKRTEERGAAAVSCVSQ